MDSLAKSAVRSGTIVSGTGSAEGSRNPRRRGAVVSETGLVAVAHRDNPTRRATLSSLAVRCGPGKKAGRSRQGHGASHGSQLILRPGKFCFIQELNEDYKDDDAEDGYKSPPGSPPRQPLTMKWQ